MSSKVWRSSEGFRGDIYDARGNLIDIPRIFEAHEESGAVCFHLTDSEGQPYLDPFWLPLQRVAYAVRYFPAPLTCIHQLPINKELQAVGHEARSNQNEGVEGQICQGYQEEIQEIESGDQEDYPDGGLSRLDDFFASISVPGFKFTMECFE